MRVILSTGAGRLHFEETAACLKEAGHDVRLITGWIPSSSWEERLADFVGLAFGRRDLARRLAVRRAGGRLTAENLRSCTVAEGLSQAAARAGDLRLIPRSAGQAATWAFFGWASRRHIHDAEVFHVRGGAGWGAIAKARKAGMRTVVDFSIAHPAFMKKVLEPHFRRFGLPFDLGPETPFWQRVLADCEPADLILANSDFVKRTLQDEGISPDRICVAYLGVRDDFLNVKSDYRQQSREFRLLFTGGFGIRKGAHILLEALELVRRDGLLVELTVAGTTAEYDRVAPQFPSHSPPNCVGMLPQIELRSLFARSDAYVFPTLAEGCAKSAMEALGAGLPVITTESCGLPGKPGVHYLQLPSLAPDALAGSILALARSEDMRAGLGRAGADLVSTQYTWRNYAATVTSAYEALIKTPHLGTP